jgi:ubiquinone/menaquinone biosynthesis C-methylase UbiE
MPQRLLLTLVASVAFTIGAAHSASAQLASRPADEWTKVLEANNRVTGLKIDEIVAALHLAPTDTVADIGAGSGLFEVPIAKAVPRGTVYAVDIDEGFFADIKKKADEAKVANVRPVLGKFTDPSLPARNIDVGFFHDVLHHVEDRAGYIKALAGYLKPSGRIVVIDYEVGQGPHREQRDLQVSREQLAGWMTAAGLKQVEDVKLFTDRYFLVYSK